jgi:hypothetical protein
VAHVSLGEQRVLRLARKRAEDLLAAVESKNGNGRGSLSVTARYANCEKVSTRLILYGRCKAVSYCGRTYQVVYYKEHKAIYLAIASKSGSNMK